jgi:hypothetical protein
MIRNTLDLPKPAVVQSTGFYEKGGNSRIRFMGKESRVSRQVGLIEGGL